MGGGDGLVHQFTGALELLRREVRPVCQKIADPLVMDFIAPPGPENTRAREVQQKIPQRRGVEDACVGEDGESGHGAGASVSHAEFLRLRGQGVQRVLALAPAFFHVGHEILELEPSACANLVVGDLLFFEFLSDSVFWNSFYSLPHFIGLR